MAKVIVKVEEYTQCRKIRTIELDLTDEQVKDYIHSRESMIYDMDEEGESTFINLVADKIDKSEFKELEITKVEEMGLLCIMRLKVIKVNE